MFKKVVLKMILQLIVLSEEDKISNLNLVLGTK
jgi:hypothetical protein